MPTARNVLRNAWFHTKSFLKRAGTIIFSSVLIVWLLASFPWGVEYGSEDSLIGIVGKQITPIFRPLGFGHWTFAVALFFGVVAKEVIIGTLGTLYGVGNEALASILPAHLSPLGAISFLFFVLLYLPCLATIAVIKKETNNLKFTLLQLLTSFSIAWIISFLIYKVGLRLG
jgi:ferrous iron transport protein B